MTISLHFPYISTLNESFGTSTLYTLHSPIFIMGPGCFLCACIPTGRASPIRRFFPICQQTQLAVQSIGAKANFVSQPIFSHLVLKKMKHTSFSNFPRRVTRNNKTSVQVNLSTCHNRHLRKTGNEKIKSLSSLDVELIKETFCPSLYAHEIYSPW